MGSKRKIQGSRHYRSALRALRYLAVGVSTFLIDLVILFALTNLLGVPYTIAVAIGFIIGITLNYAISRAWVFRGTEQHIHHGYAYFLGGGLVSLTAILTLVTVFVERLGIPLLFARILVSGIVGCGNYLFNLYLNFKVAGKHIH